MKEKVFIFYISPITRPETAVKFVRFYLMRVRTRFKRNEIEQPGDLTSTMKSVSTFKRHSQLGKWILCISQICKKWWLCACLMIMCLCWWNSGTRDVFIYRWTSEARKYISELPKITQTCLYPIFQSARYLRYFFLWQKATNLLSKHWLNCCYVSGIKWEAWEISLKKGELQLFFSSFLFPYHHKNSKGSLLSLFSLLSEPHLLKTRIIFQKQ